MVPLSYRAPVVKVLPSYHLAVYPVTPAPSTTVAGINPETVAISEVKVWPVVTRLLATVLMFVVSVWPVVTKLLLKFVMSVSLDVIWVCNVCPVVIRFPLMSSTMLPVETRFVETVLMFVVNVCPVVTRLLLVVLKFDVRAVSYTHLTLPTKA